MSIFSSLVSWSKGKAKRAAAELAPPPTRLKAPLRDGSRGTEPLPIWRPGDVILDLYEVEKIITTGGMARIYVTRHRDWNVKVAIKSPTEASLPIPVFNVRWAPRCSLEVCRRPASKRTACVPPSYTRPCRQLCPSGEGRRAAFLQARLVHRDLKRATILSHDWNTMKFNEFRLAKAFILKRAVGARRGPFLAHGRGSAEAKSPLCRSR